METKVCQECKREYPRRENEAKTRFQFRKYCSQDCALKVAKRNFKIT